VFARGQGELTFDYNFERYSDKLMPCRCGAPRARSHCRFVRPHIHFIPDSLTYAVALFLNRQCDRTLGAPSCTGFIGGDANAKLKEIAYDSDSESGDDGSPRDAPAPRRPSAAGRTRVVKDEDEEEDWDGGDVDAEKVWGAGEDDKPRKGGSGGRTPGRSRGDKEAAGRRRKTEGRKSQGAAGPSPRNRYEVWENGD
jgi:hypothetical protein